MHLPHPEFLESISGFLGGYYLTLSLMNAVAAFILWHYRHRSVQALVWICVAFALLAIAPLAMSGSPPELPIEVRKAINEATGPVIYSVGTTSFLALMFI